MMDAAQSKANEIAVAQQQAAINFAINCVCIVSIVWNVALVFLAVLAVVLSKQPPPIEGIVFCFLPTAAMHVIVQSLRSIRLPIGTEK